MNTRKDNPNPAPPLALYRPVGVSAKKFRRRAGLLKPVQCPSCRQFTRQTLLPGEPTTLLTRLKARLLAETPAKPWRECRSCGHAFVATAADVRSARA